MSSREQIFTNIRAALQDLPDDARTAYPQWDDDLCVCHDGAPFRDLWSHFCDKCRAANGVPLDGLHALVKWMSAQGLDHGYCDPALLPHIAPFIPADLVTIESVFDRARVDTYAFGITRACAAIAETGTIVLNDALTSSRLGALAPWVHIAIVSPEDILRDVPTAIRRLGDDPNTIFVTGPSKTADVEGILIEGVHGPGVQVCCRAKLGK